MPRRNESKVEDYAPKLFSLKGSVPCSNESENGTELDVLAEPQTPSSTSIILRKQRPSKQPDAPMEGNQKLRVKSG